jgi:RNA polymerase sigma-70 factor (ECF subfamily)
MPTNRTALSERQGQQDTALEDEKALVRRSLSDPDAFAELYQRYVERIYCFHLVRTGIVDEAQDLTSQTFLAALNGLRSYSGRSSFCGWLFGIAKNKVSDHFRRRRNESDLETMEDIASSVSSLEDTVSTHLQMAQVTKALKSLIPEQAEAIVLRIFGELSAAEVGKMMGKSEAAVKMLVHRGLKNLQVKLSPDKEVLS